MMTTEISNEWVEETWQEIGSLQDEMKAAALSQSFTKKQPALAEFILTFTKDLSTDAHELAYYIALVVWRCYESHFKQQLREIQSDEVIEEHKKTDKWLGSLEKVDSRFLSKRILNGADYEQRYILQYIVEAIFESRGFHFVLKATNFLPSLLYPFI